MRTMAIAVGVSIILLGPCFAQNTKVPATRVETRIPPQLLGDALRQFAKLDHLHLLYLTADVKNLRTRGASGYLTADETLGRLLSETGLTYRYIDAHAVSIFSDRARADATHSTSETGKLPYRPPAVLDKGASAPKVEPPDPPSPKKRQSVAKPTESRLQEVVVTGTLIPGVRNLASPLTVFTREDINDSGAATLQDFMQAQSFDFGGGASVDPIGSANGGASADNDSNGTGFNLRGLGNDATLVLLDGHRIAPGNVYANFVDTSLIPLNAIERVEVEPAGASATYGDDAVGGVVNLITRRNFSGLETQIHYGSVAQSGSREIQIGQMGGMSWGSGSMVLGYQFYDFSPLNARDRSYLYPAGMEPTLFTLMDEQARQSAFISLQQNASEAINLYATGVYSRRATDAFQIFGTQEEPLFASITGPDHTSMGEGILGAGIALNATDLIDVSLAYSGSQTDYVSPFNPSPTFQGISPSVAYDASYSTLSLNGKLTGSFGALPAGSLRFAIGGEVRRDGYDFKDLIAESAFEPSRRVLSAFLELNIPLLSSESASVAAPLLSADLAGRVDHYSDFGTSANPNVGITWRPLRLLKLRTSFGTSFVAPNLADLNGIPQVTYTVAEQDPLTGGYSNVIASLGGNPDLRPETADVLTLGADFGADSPGGFRGGVTYYHIDFQHEITRIDEAGFDPTNALELENELGPSIVQRNPPLSELEYLANQPTYVDLVPGGASLGSIVAFVNDNDLNLSRIKTDGIDFHSIYTHGSPYGSLEVGLDGTYVLNFKTQITPVSSLLSLLNTPYNPVDFKARAKVGISHGEWFFAAFFNYVNHYKDNRIPPTVPVASWSTTDLNLRYTIPGDWGVLRDASLSLSVRNAGNRRPPFVAAPAGDGLPQADYDGASANVLGRVISLDVNLRY